MGLSQREQYAHLASIVDQNQFIQACKSYQAQGLDWASSHLDYQGGVDRLKVISRILRTGGAITKNGQLVQFSSDSAQNYLNPYISTWYARDRNRLVTSDHMMVTRRFKERIQGKPDTSLTVSTWNMMNQGHSRDRCPNGGGYSNNPENLDELFDDYEVRTYIQIQQMIEHIHAQRPAAILLQEVNFLYSTFDRCPRLKNILTQELNQRGYRIITSSPNDKSGKKQAIIYDDNQLKHENGTHYEMPGQKQDNRRALFMADFTDRATNRKVCISSMHLHYDNDYSNTLIEHASTTASRKNALYIAGGDTNHTPGTQIQGVMGDFTKATNYDLGSTTHGDDPNRLKCYDTFAACSSCGTVASTQLAGQCFVVTEQGRMAVEDYDAISQPQVSLSGRPWVRPDTLVLDVLGYRDEILKGLDVVFGPEHMKTFKKQETVKSLEKSVQTHLDNLRLPYDLVPDFWNKIHKAKLLLSKNNKHLLGNLWNRVDRPEGINWDFVHLAGDDPAHGSPSQTHQFQSSTEMVLSAFGATEASAPSLDAFVLNQCGYRDEIMRSLDDHGLLSREQIAVVRGQQTIALLLKEALICITEGQPYVQSEVYPLEKLDALIKFLEQSITDSKYQDFINKIKEAEGLLLNCDSSLQTDEYISQIPEANESRGVVYGPQSPIAGQSSNKLSLELFKEKHKDLFKEDKKRAKGMSYFLKSKVGENDSLEAVLGPKRIEKGTRSAQVVYDLNWVDREGNLTATAPDDVKQAWHAARVGSSFRRK